MIEKTWEEKKAIMIERNRIYKMSPAYKERQKQKELAREIWGTGENFTEICERRAV